MHGNIQLPDVQSSTNLELASKRSRALAENGITRSVWFEPVIAVSRSLAIHQLPFAPDARMLFIASRRDVEIDISTTLFLLPRERAITGTDKLSSTPSKGRDDPAGEPAQQNMD